MTDREDLHARIRERAHEIWRREGCPDGRSEVHWAKAREEIADEDEGRRSGPADGAEPLAAVRNLGQVPGLTDQGDGRAYPTDPAAVGTPATAPDRPAARPAGRARKRR